MPWASVAVVSHRHGSAYSGNGPRKIVRAAQMSGQNGHGKPPAFVHHYHSRVGSLALAVGRDGPHCKTRSSYKYQRIRMHKLCACPFCKRNTIPPAPGNTAGQGDGQTLC